MVEYSADHHARCMVDAYRQTLRQVKNTKHMSGYEIQMRIRSLAHVTLACNSDPICMKLAGEVWSDPVTPNGLVHNLGNILFARARQDLLGHIRKGLSRRAPSEQTLTSNVFCNLYTRYKTVNPLAYFDLDKSLEHVNNLRVLQRDKFSLVRWTKKHSSTELASDNVVWRQPDNWYSNRYAREITLLPGSKDEIVEHIHNVSHLPTLITALGFLLSPYTESLQIPGFSDQVIKGDELRMAFLVNRPSSTRQVAVFHGPARTCIMLYPYYESSLSHMAKRIQHLSDAYCTVNPDAPKSINLDFE